MSKFTQIVGFISAVLSIAAICLAVYNNLKVDRLQQHFEAIKPLKMEISISKPEDGSEIRDFVTEVSGQIIIKSPDNTAQKTETNITIAEKGIEVFPLVRPLSEANIWYAQTKPSINKDGIFTGSVNIGDKEGRGIGVRFQIVMLAVPKGTIRQGDTFRDLPPYGCASKTVTVRRI